MGYRQVFSRFLCDVAGVQQNDKLHKVDKNRPVESLSGRVFVAISNLYQSFGIYDLDLS